MDLKISFRKAEVKNGFVSVAYNGKPNLLPQSFTDLKNVDQCQSALVSAIQALNKAVEANEIEPGCYYISKQETGRKVRNFDKWDKSIQYVDVKEKV